MARLKNLLRSLAEVPLTLTVKQSDDGHTLVLRSEKSLTIGTGYRVTAELLTLPGNVRLLPAGAPADAEFSRVPLADVTPFVVLTATDVEHSKTSSPIEYSTVVHAALVDDPPERLDVVLARQVDTPEKFLRFLALLLGLADISSLLDSTAEGAPFDGGEWGAGTGSGVFEIIVNALADRPEALRDLGTLVERLQSTDARSKVLPPGFDRIWESAATALSKLEEGTA
jgi:hypothetical protein